MPDTVDITIEPNEKYERVVGYDTADVDRTKPVEEWPDEHREATNAYIETVESAPTPSDDDDVKTLSWDDISPANDPDLLAKVATYFDGMDPSEGSDRLWAKCRLLDVEVYVNAQIAARAERRGSTSTGGVNIRVDSSDSNTVDIDTRH